jgi:hypothetical protein
MNIKNENIENAFEKIRDGGKSFDYSIDVDGKEIKRYKGLVSIILDLEFVSDSIRLLNDMTDKKQKTVERSLFISSIITYGRCFTQTRGRGTKLDKSDSIKPQFIELHEYIMELRHEYIAHAGISDAEKFYATLHFKRMDSKDIDMRLGYEGFGQIGLNAEQIKLFIELVKDLTTSLKQKREQTVATYFSSLTLKDKQELFKKASDKTLNSSNNFPSTIESLSR